MTASCTNGGISVGSMDNLEVTENSRRHLEGKLNGGGTQVELSTTNGGVRLRAHDSVNTRTDTDARDDKDDAKEFKKEMKDNAKELKKELKETKTPE